MNTKNTNDTYENNNYETEQPKEKKVIKNVKPKQFDYTFKIVLIGDSGVGKSCILLRFADDQFNENFYATIGVDFRFKNIEIDGKNVKLQIWDTAGQERFKTITSAYYRGADGIFIVYDITDRNSFIHLRDWLDDVSRLATDDPIKVIIGNKCDLDYKKEVFDTDIKSLEEQTGIEIVQASAKESIKINTVMENITRKLIERAIKRGGSSLSSNSKILNVEKTKENEKANCC